MHKEYVIYCDESESKGSHYSNFYGGTLVRSSDLTTVVGLLEHKKTGLNLYQEIKWQKVTATYLDKYCALMDAFFDLVKGDKVKVRIMFTQNRYQARDLEAYHREHEYFLLYYQFIKHAFGLRYSNRTGDPVNVRVHFDRLPDTREKCATFKDFIYRLSLWPEFAKSHIHIRRDQLAEVDSRDHVLLQCLDVVLGAMQFRLNHKHELKPLGARCRAKKTIAKEKLYVHINRRIRDIYPGHISGIQHWDYHGHTGRLDEYMATPLQTLGVHSGGIATFSRHVRQEISPTPAMPFGVSQVKLETSRNGGLLKYTHSCNTCATRIRKKK
jgi:hypothetical protein